jgi:uncharacterized ion transporter superfamily protein YfcC
MQIGLNIIEGFKLRLFYFILFYLLNINFMFFDRASRNNRVKKNQLDAQLIISIFRQPLHVSVVSR